MSNPPCDDWAMSIGFLIYILRSAYLRLHHRTTCIVSGSCSCLPHFDSEDALTLPRFHRKLPPEIMSKESTTNFCDREIKK